MMILPCPECCDDPPQDNCIIDTDDFSGDLSKWDTISGSPAIVSGHLEMTAGDALDLLAEPTGDNDSTKIVFKVRCTNSTGTAIAKIAGTEEGDYLGAEMTRDGDCLTFRLCQLFDGDTTYLTESVAQFATGSGWLNFEMCWRQGPAIEAEAGDTTDKLAGTGSSVSWTDPNNITAEDGNPAVYFVAGAGATPNLDAINFPLAALIPIGSSIDGIEVKLKVSRGVVDPGEGTLTSLRLVDETGTPVGDDKGTDQEVSDAGYTTIAAGGAADTWNAGLTRDQVCSANFGFTFFFSCDVSTEFNVDACWVRIWFTSPDRGPGTLTATATPDSFPSSDGYDADSLAMAQVRVQWPRG